MDPRIQRMADVIVGYAVAVRPGDWVVIRTTTEGESLARACVLSSLRAGGNPTVLLESDAIESILMHEGSDVQLSFASPIDRLLAETADVMIRIRAASTSRPSLGVDPGKIALRRRALSASSSIVSRRDVESSLRRTITQFPTEGAARDAGMSLAEYENFVYGAAFLNEPDPVAAWRDLAKRQAGLIDVLRTKRTVHVRGEGTDLTLSIAGRAWTNSDGHRNFPSGEVFTGPIEDATEGTIVFNTPAFLEGNEVRGVRLKFERGRVVTATAEVGESFLLEMLDLDAGARVLGEFAFGTNEGIQQFTRNILFDEKIGGTIHMALGNAYPETGGTNVSALHWDMVYDLRLGAEVTLDGQPFSVNSEFRI